MSEADASQVPESVMEVDVTRADENETEEGDTAGTVANVDGESDSTGAGAGDTLTNTNPQTVFLDYLKSPIVEIIVGGSNDGDEEPTMLRAHQAILTKSSYLAEQLNTLSDTDPLKIELPDETIDTVGCFLQYQYTGEYFPRRSLEAPDVLETDASIPLVDETGAQLLKHARIYNLAEKLGLPELKTLAHSKIHRINSTAVGEIVYARYVYGNTPKDDVTIRRPVAAFWATRSHVLRHEAEAEFRAMCLEYPEFGFDVLSLVLDQREKRGRDREIRDEETTSGRGKKRPRPSVNI